jgi:hypothetical protein
VVLMFSPLVMMPLCKGHADDGEGLRLASSFAASGARSSYSIRHLVCRISG